MTPIFKIPTPSEGSGIVSIIITKVINCGSSRIKSFLTETNMVHTIKTGGHAKKIEIYII